MSTLETLNMFLEGVLENINSDLPFMHPSRLMALFMAPKNQNHKVYSKGLNYILRIKRPRCKLTDQVIFS